ncbi:hypothetical protein [Salsuginibacillus halophilus]|nr:hypothetical protein [Salsuginibacillus halophilus]
MEKAMQQSHGMGFEEYSQSLTKRLQVERERERNYQMMNQMTAELNARP